MDIKQLLNERRKTHGDFTVHARVTQRLKAVIYEELALQGKRLSFSELESLDMITHKIGRVVSGNSLHADHWDDISGYATLVSERIKDGVLMPEETNDTGGADVRAAA